ncbi:MAG: L-aspartate oxidase [Planctomycetota bacterium]|nr:L-aspartate oxidase [Planctomycetota bacterium]
MDHPYLQRRYLLSFESRRLPHIFTDVLIVGGGVAGLRAAIEASAGGAQVILTTKARLAESNSYYAQGGLAAVLDAADDIERHVADTLAAGAGTSDEAVVRHVISAAPQCVRELLDWGVRFDREGADLSLGREGGHTANRIIHANGDATGKALIETLVERTRGSANVKCFEECFVIDLLTDPPAGGAGAACVGAITFHPRFGLQIIRAKRTILAAGGAGVLWRETTNPSIATADGIAMAFRAGAAVADAEMMQFHPTVLYVARAPRSLISEAVRGEGGILIDRHGKRIMDGVHEMGDLAPRDVVSRAILERMVQTGSTHVFLDVRHLGGEAFAKRFPQIDRRCREFGIDPGRDVIPVHPAAHYMIGGAKVDLNGQTSIAGLLACGEAACSGLHGANRLASNSLTEALVFGQRCGQLAAAAGDDDRLAAAKIDWTNPRSERTQLDLADIRNSLRSILWRNVGIARRGERLSETLEIVQFWGRYVLDKEFFDPAGWEIQNMLTSAYLLTEAALRRTETRGVHYRSDFPDTDPVWARHQVMRRTEYQLVVE